MTATPHVHFVTVEHEHDDAGDVISSTLTFECRAAAGDPCRVYPACDCEYWHDEHDREHPRVPQDECWLKSWFDVDYDVTPYDDGDATVDSLHLVPAGSGPIAYDFEYDYVAWRWVDHDAADVDDLFTHLDDPAVRGTSAQPGQAQ